MSVISYVFFDIIRFSLAWPLTARSVNIMVEVVRTFLLRGIPCCEYLFRHIVSRKVLRLFTFKAVIIPIISAWVYFFFFLSKELLYYHCKDF